MSPSDRSSASRILTSISGPRMTPRISGSTGMPKRRIAKPSAPKTSSRARSKVLVDAVGTERGEEQDAGVELGPRDLQQLGPQRRQRQVDHQQQGVADQQAGEQRPDQVGLVGHQRRAGLDAVGLHGRQDDRGGRGDRQPEGEQRDEHAGGAGVVGGLRAGDALDGALAELLGVLAAGELALGDVGQERRRLGAAGRQRAEREAERGAAQPRLPRAAPVVAAHERPPDRDDLERPAAQVRGDPQRLADGEHRRPRRPRCRCRRRAASMPKVSRAWPVEVEADQPDRRGP